MKLVLCALISIGALSACATASTPIPVVTLTLIPITQTQITPSATATTAPPTPTAIITPSSTPILIQPLLQTTVTPDASQVLQVLDAVAAELAVNPAQIQIVKIEPGVWYDAALGCDQAVDLALDVAFATYQPDQRMRGLAYTLLLEDTLYEYHRADSGDARLCQMTQPLSGDVLLAVDPIAVEIVQIARRRIANQLDLSDRRVMLMSVNAYTWPDTSLGCPQPDQTYQPLAIVGYRIVLESGGQSFIFHSDSVSVFPCPAGEEQLP